MPERRLLDDCFLTDRERLRHDEALAILRQRVSPIVGTDRVSLDRAFGRVLADAVRSPRAVPASDNSAVDGYAFAHADFEPTGGCFPLAARIAAGDATPAPLPPFCAARIFTGAVMPERADTVAMQEDCEVREEDGRTYVVIPQGLKRGANRRKAGEDLAEGALVAAPGRRLRPQDVAAIASTGQAEAAVFERLRVALVSTGNEIVRPGSSLASGQVYDSNTFLLRALLEPLGAEVTDLGVVPDDAGAVRAALAEAASGHHAVIATGGASRGEEDHLVASLDALGQRHLWQLAVKPGRPMSFGRIAAAHHDCVVLALPGNPVAAFVCFLVYARPTLLRLGGADWAEPQRFLVEADFEVAGKKRDRREFLRGRLVAGEDGRPSVTKFPRDGSGLITSLREADGLVELVEETVQVRRGDAVPFLPFSQFGIA